MRQRRRQTRSTSCLHRRDAGAAGDLHGHRADDPAGHHQRALRRVARRRRSPGHHRGPGRRRLFALRASNNGTSRPVRREQLTTDAQDAVAKTGTAFLVAADSKLTTRGHRRARTRATPACARSAWSPGRDFAEMRDRPAPPAASHQASGGPWPDRRGPSGTVPVPVLRHPLAEPAACGASRSARLGPGAPRRRGTPPQPAPEPETGAQTGTKTQAEKTGTKP